jgi:indole-3-acetate monooxygenase
MDSLLSERARPYSEQIQKIAATIREHADRAEREAQIPREVVDAFHDAGLFRILIPREMGGAELTIPDSLRLTEEVARIDGSVGWNFAICAGGPIFGYNLSRAAFEKIYGDPRGVSAGSLNPMTTQVVAVEGGWRLIGKATYASASAHATYLMAAGLVLRDGAAQIVGGVPVLRAGLFPIKHAKILDTWSTAGMRGTGSNDCVYENVFVPDEFTFDWLNAKSSWVDGPLANIPLQLQFVGGLVSVVLGTARHALDTLNEIAQSKVPAASRGTLRERPIAQTQYAQAEGLLNAARAYFYNCNDGAQGRSGRELQYSGPRACTARGRDRGEARGAGGRFGRRCSRDERGAEVLRDRTMLARRAYRDTARADEHRALRGSRPRTPGTRSRLAGHLA